MKRTVVSIGVNETVPSAVSVLTAQGVPEGASTDKRVRRLADDSVSIYRQLAEPAGILAGISMSDCENIYVGESLNEDVTPLESIFKSADTLCLFAVTIGSKITNRISDLFNQREFALGSMLDSAASEGTENAAQWIENYYVDYLTSVDKCDESIGVLRFSPGYCGWHVSAQKKLFRYLDPAAIGISLTESCLMQPLKSISGVIISGKKEIFDFEDTFPFCSECSDHSCTERIRAVMEH
ncbi:MAG: vitamin B12 dependent-methionine synthase activation domain-containing protein [Candidatus Zixiibacteriota bacterium]